MTIANGMPRFSVRELNAALQSFSPLTRDLAPRAILQPYPADRVIQAFERLAEPLSRARLRGQLINPWWIAGLKRDELRVAHALSGLWMVDFGGETSRRFLAACLSACIQHVDWYSELALGYRVAREVNPLGAGSDRVDLIIETPAHVVGIEVKIDARLGRNQLERYKEAIETRAQWRHATGHVAFLASFDCDDPDVGQLHWSMVGEAAEASVSGKASARAVVEQLIASFGDYVKDF